MSTPLAAALVAAPYFAGPADSAEATVLYSCPIPGGSHNVVECGGDLYQLFVDSNYNDISHELGDDLINILAATGSLPTMTVRTRTALRPRHKRSDAHSVCYTLCDDSGEPVTDVTLYRALAPGQHPEIESLAAAAFPQAEKLTNLLSAHIQGRDIALGKLTAPLAGVTGSTAAQECFQAGVYSNTHAEELGATVRVMHDALLLGFPPSITAPHDFRETAHADVCRMAKNHPELQPHAPWVHTIIEGIEEDVPAQRIHGNLTLDSLHTDGTKWVISGFGGNPRASFDERRAPHSPLWDLATLIASLELSTGSTPWTCAVVASLRNGYEGTSDDQCLDLYRALVYMEMAAGTRAIPEVARTTPLELLTELSEKYRGADGAR